MQSLVKAALYVVNPVPRVESVVSGDRWRHERYIRSAVMFGEKLELVKVRVTVKLSHYSRLEP